MKRARFQSAQDDPVSQAPQQPARCPKTCRNWTTLTVIVWLPSSKAWGKLTGVASARRNSCRF
eukprot:3938832-Rhodomonas_salina.2